jgi:hypothetical protein
VIVDDRLKGGQLLDYLYAKMQSGNLLLHRTYSDIMQMCYAILFKQLETWMCYAQILDMHEEFFIQRIDSSNSEYNWENSFSLKISMLSLSFISVA